MCINLFQLYGKHAKTQLICDAIADGAAVAGLTPAGFDETRMKEAARKIAEYNGLTNMDYTIDVDDEKDKHGNYTGNKLITVDIRIRGDYYGSQYLGLTNHFSIKAHSVVRAEVDVTNYSLLQTSYYDISATTPPFVTTTQGTRNPFFNKWLIGYYLCPQHNPIYVSQNEVSHAHKLLYDYLLCTDTLPLLECDALMWPFYFTSPSPAGNWTQLTDAAEIQAAADAGETVILTVIPDDTKTAIDGLAPFDSLSEEEASTLFYSAKLYLVIPSSSVMQEGCVHVAHANANPTNSMYIDIQNLGKNGKVYFAWKTT